MFRSCPAAVLFFLISLFTAPICSADDWRQWGGSSLRNNVVNDIDVPTEWHVGKYDFRTKKWDRTNAQNIKWTANLGSQSYGTPVVSGGRIFVGSNNSGRYLKRCQGDYGCMLCFRESDGQFLWQYSSEKLDSGRVNDWPEQGIVSTPLVDGDRVWFVNNRGEVVCADTHGFHDNEDDGPAKGLRARLFSITSNISPESNWKYYYPAARLLRIMADEGHIPFPGYPRIRRETDGTLDVFDASRKDSEAVLKVSFDGSDVTLTPLTTDQDDKDGAGSFTVKSDLRSGLSEGNLNSTLRHLLSDRGFDLANPISVTELAGKTSWAVTAVVNGHIEAFLLECENDTMTAYRPLSIDDKREADVVWTFDMMKELGVRQHNMATCSVTSWGDTLFVCTSNGVDETHTNIPAPDAPAFIALDRKSGQLLWADNSPGRNILHGQWGSPAAAKLGGVPQVIFGGGDGWVYSFRADRWKDKRPELLWKFDANPKDSKWILGGRGTRSNVVCIPVIYDGLVYIVTGQDPEHGEGEGHLWCIDPTKRGDVSPELVVDRDNKPLPHFKLHAATDWGLIFQVNDRMSESEGILGDDVSPELREQFRKAGYDLPDKLTIQQTGEDRYLTVELQPQPVAIANANSKAKHPQRFKLVTRRGRYDSSIHPLSVYLETHSRVIANPNSAVVWHYSDSDWNKDGEVTPDEEFHRTVGNVAIKNDILFVADLSGFVHCLNAKSGNVHWTCDLYAACWGSPLIVGNSVYISDEDGDVAVFTVSADWRESLKQDVVLGKNNKRYITHSPLREMTMNSSVYSTAVAANGVLYIADRSRLYAISKPKK